VSVLFGHINEMSDGIDDMIEVVIDLVFPKSKDDPAFFDIVVCDIGIAFDVSSNLLTPKIGIRLWQFEVEGTAVPIARVQKYDDA